MPKETHYLSRLGDGKEAPYRVGTSTDYLDLGSREEVVCELTELVRKGFRDFCAFPDPDGQNPLPPGREGNDTGRPLNKNPLEEDDIGFIERGVNGKYLATDSRVISIRRSVG